MVVMRQEAKERGVWGEAEGVVGATWGSCWASTVWGRKNYLPSFTVLKRHRCGPSPVGSPGHSSVCADLDQGRAIRKLYLKGRCSQCNRTWNVEPGEHSRQALSGSLLGLVQMQVFFLYSECSAVSLTLTLYPSLFPVYPFTQQIIIGYLRCARHWRCCVE